MRKISLEEYATFTKGERAVLRRAAFGHPLYVADLIAEATGIDLNHLKELLSNQNAQTGIFPERWVDTKED